MAEAFAGKDKFFSVGLTQGAQTTLSGEGGDGQALGLDTVNLSKVFEEFLIPGGSGTTRQSSGIENSNIPFTCDYNAVTGPVLYGNGGQTVYFTYGPQGNSSGSPQYTGSGILAVDESGTSRSKITLNCNIAVNGKVTQGTF